MDDEENEVAQGVLSLDSGLRDYFVDHIGILSGLAASSGIDISHISSEEIQNQFLAIVGGLLENMISNPASTTNSDILIKCLDLLDKSCEVSNLLATHFSRQLTLLLIQDKYPDFRNSICKLLTTTEYEFNEEQTAELNKFVISSNSTPLLKLLISKEIISTQSLAYIINATKTIQSNDPNYAVYKKQVLIIVESLQDDSRSCELLSPQLLDFFKLSQDKSLILPIAKLINDQGCFETYFNEIKITLKSLADSLEINCLREELRKQPDNLALKQRLLTWEFIDIVPKLYHKWYPVKFEDWTNQWAKGVIDRGEFETIEGSLPNYKLWLSYKREFIDILPKIMPESYPVGFENWTNQWGKGIVDNADFKTIASMLPTYRQQLQKLVESGSKFEDKSQSDELILGYGLQYKNLQGYLETITTTYNSIKKLLENKVSISRELVDLYDQFLIDILRNETLASNSGVKKEYRTLLEVGYKYSLEILSAKYDLSEKLIESLINKASNDPSISGSLIINYLISSILAELAKQDKLPKALIVSSIEILKKNVNFAFIHTVPRVATAFKYLACSGIENDSFTAKLCVEALSKVADEVKGLILSGIEAIVTNSSKLSEEVISTLIKLITDPDQQIEQRIRAIKLLQRAPKSLREEDISSLSTLLEGEQRFILSDIDSTRKMFLTSRYDYDNEYRDWESLQEEIFKGIRKEGLDLDLNSNAFNRKDDQNYYYQATDIRLIQNEIMKPFLGIFTIHEPIGDSRYVNQVLSTLVLSLDEHKPTLCVYNLGNWHWVSFAALKINDEVYVLYKDSKGTVNKKFEKLITEIDGATRFITNTSCEQTSGVECGIFALKNMLIMAEQLQNNKEEFIKGFEEFKGFCSLESAQELRAGDFAAEYVVGKYSEMNVADLHLRQLQQLREQHSSEAVLIEQKLREVKLLREFTIKALAANEELTNTTGTIAIEIATNPDTEPTRIDYVYGYRISISDNLKARKSEIFQIISEELQAHPYSIGDKSIIFSADHVSVVVKVPKAAINDQGMISVGMDRLSKNLSIEADSEEEAEVIQIIRTKIGTHLHGHIPDDGIKDLINGYLGLDSFIPVTAPHTTDKTPDSGSAAKKFKNIHKPSFSTPELLAASETELPEAVDYKLATLIAELIVKYAEINGTLPPGIIDKLEQSFKESQNPLSTASFKALSIIAKKSPTLLNEELVEYIKTYDPETGKQVAFNTSLELLTAILSEGKEEVSDLELSSIKEELDKIKELLKVSRLQNMDKLYDLAQKILIVVPDLFNECLSLIKLRPFACKNIALIELLLDTGQLTNQDICLFITYGYTGVKLFTALEQYFNDSFISLIEDTASLKEVLVALDSLVGMGGTLKEETINKLIELAKVNPAQAINIGKILFTAHSCLTDDRFILIEEIFKGAGLQLTFLLAKLFAKAHKQLTTASAVAAVFQELNARTPLSILPTEELRTEAKALLALKLRNPGLDKLTIIQSLHGKLLQTETIKTVAALVKHKSLSEECIKVLASQEHIPPLAEEVSEIICKSKNELPDEYLKLKSFLSIDADSFLLTQEQLKIKELIEQRFAEIYVTDYGIEKIAQTLNKLPYSPEFNDKIILSAILNKANSLEEWYVFLEFLIKNNISEEQLPEYLEQPSLTKITDVIESKILSESLQELKALEHLNLEEIVNQITYLCYQLKSSGWSSQGLAHILQKITGDNIHYFASSLKTIFEYRITEEQRNKQGECISDIIDRYSGDVLEPSVYQIANNQFEHKTENKGGVLLEKIIELNPELAEKQAEYLSTLESIRNIYVDSTKGEAICNWSAEQVKEWAIKFKDNHKNGGNKKPLDKEELVEVMAVLQRANNLHSAKGGKDGHLLRDTQIISLLLLLDAEESSKGKLLQVATGEGKSTISAMLAAILALYGYKIDLITSSRVLAFIGQESSEGFLAMLGLKSSCNLKTRGASGRQNVCYDSDIVYGDALTFQSDLLSNTSNHGPRRGGREFSITIVDEVDSMLLDSVNHLAKQATPTPLMEYVLPVMTMAWDNFHKIILPLNLETEIAIEEATKLINHFINLLPIPKHLEAYAKFQAKNWGASLVNAATRMEPDRDYVININHAGHKVINPVDSSTGVTQESMVWYNGLHQFLQIKHNCRISAETLTSFFITNIAYFLKYDRILGMTGTLGGEGSQEFLKTIYGVDIAFVPTYKDKQVIELADRIENTKSRHVEAIVSSSYQEAVLHNRAVLVVCQTIKDAEELSLQIKQRCGNKAKVIKYLRSEESLYNYEIESTVSPNTIIVATNLAGRGTDIRTSPETEANGGLHVISTFIAKNARDEEQVKGRTARQGNCGSYQIIALVRDYYDHESFGLSAQELIDNIRHNRDIREYEGIKYSIEHSIPGLLAQDDIYTKFSKFYLELLNSTASNDYRIKNCKLKQLIEDFGLWLQIGQNSTDIDQFLVNAKEKYEKGIFTNPSYIVIQHGLYEKRTWFGSINTALSKATMDIDNIYSFAAHYYMAKSYLNSDSDNYKNKTVESLMETANRVNEIISYLTAMNISVAGSGINEGNELLKQVTTKIDFFKSFTKHIEAAIKVITESGEREVRVKSTIDKRQLTSDLTPDDIAEIDFLGINEIFEVETYKPKKNWFDSVVVALCSIAQMAIGVLLTMKGNFKIGSKIFISGLMDAYKVGMALSKGRAIDLDEYLSSKAIDYALIAVEVKYTEVSKAHDAKKAIETGVKESITQGGKEVIKQGAKESIVQLAKTAGLHMAKTVAVEKIAEWAASEVKENLLDGLEERVASSVSKITESVLEKNVILLSPDCNIERQQILKEIQNAVFKATKTHKHARVINELASGVFKASSSLPSEFHSIGKVLYAGHKIGSMGDIISKIEPIIDDLKQAIENIVNQAAARANIRLKGSFKTSSLTEQKNICDSLSRNIGSMVGDAILNLIQRKVTNPMISWGVSYIIDESVENYQREQQMLVANHKHQIKQAEELEQDLSKKINPKQKAPGEKPQQLPLTPQAFDYSLLIGQKTNQELVQLNEQSMEYLTYFFEASEKKTQKAEEVRVYDVTRSTAQSSMFFSSLPRVSFIPTANANPLVFTTATEIELSLETLAAAIYGLGKSGIALGRTVLSSGPAMLPVAGFVTATSLTYRIGLDYANDVQKYSKLASSNNTPLKITAADYVLANRMGGFDADNPHDMESLEHIARGIAIERSNKQQSLRVTELPSIDFKVMGRVDGQGHGGLVNPYFDIDLNANKPTTLSTPIPYQPKSILFTPEDPDNYLKWSKLPGFTPHVLNLKDLQEGRDVHETHWKDFILYNDYEIDHWNVKPASIKDAPEVYQSGKFGKIYKDPEQTVGNKEIWWSKDTAKHGGASQGLTPSTYKLFVVKDSAFEWIGDADATGKVIQGKTKSNIGDRIPLKQCWKVK